MLERRRSLPLCLLFQARMNLARDSSEEERREGAGHLYENAAGECTQGGGGDNNAAGLGGGWFSEWEPSLRSCVEPLGE